MNLLHAAIILLAGFVAGMINSVAGGGTLLTFPILVWLGRAPIPANATNAVAICPGSFASMIGFRREIRDSRRWLLLLGLPSAAGAVVGAILLLRTPPATFETLVPLLILGATILFAAQEPLIRLLRLDPESPRSNAWWAGAIVFQFFVALYGGYFGAGMGILMLAALALLGLTDIHRMNGLKNFFAACINGVAAIYFIWRGSIIWPDAIVMIVGTIAGGYGGAGIARRLGRGFVRRAVVFIGLAMTLSLFFKRL
ncbi:MAG: sulfite exporter TauE/SafE family protein [Blastocatellia bacterium AA13]|nr:MAG: sulfite exporter TauE/SafE family protein [Blastocatellia bacterium AA13]